VGDQCLLVAGTIQELPPFYSITSLRRFVWSKLTSVSFSLWALLLWGALIGAALFAGLAAQAISAVTLQSVSLHYSRDGLYLSWAAGEEALRLA